MEDDRQSYTLDYMLEVGDKFASGERPSELEIPVILEAKIAKNFNAKKNIFRALKDKKRSADKSPAPDSLGSGLSLPDQFRQSENRSFNRTRNRNSRTEDTLSVSSNAIHTLSNSLKDSCSFNTEYPHRNRVNSTNHLTTSYASRGAPRRSDAPNWRASGFPRPNNRSRKDKAGHNAEEEASGDYNASGEELEPEWVTGGPDNSSQLIELRGFDDDPRQTKSDALDDSKEKLESRMTTPSPLQFEPANPSPMSFAEDVASKMDFPTSPFPLSSPSPAVVPHDSSPRASDDVDIVSLMASFGHRYVPLDQQQQQQLNLHPSQTSSARNNPPIVYRTPTMMANQKRAQPQQNYQQPRAQANFSGFQPQAAHELNQALLYESLKHRQRQSEAEFGSKSAAMAGMQRDSTYNAPNEFNQSARRRSPPPGIRGNAMFPWAGNNTTQTNQVHATNPAEMSHIRAQQSAVVEARWKEKQMQKLLAEAIGNPNFASSSSSPTTANAEPSSSSGHGAWQNKAPPMTQASAYSNPYALLRDTHRDYHEHHQQLHARSAKAARSDSDRNASLINDPAVVYAKGIAGEQRSRAASFHYNGAQYKEQRLAANHRVADHHANSKYANMPASASSSTYIPTYGSNQIQLVNLQNSDQATQELMKHEIIKRGLQPSDIRFFNLSNDELCDLSKRGVLERRKIFNIMTAKTHFQNLNKMGAFNAGKKDERCDAPKMEHVGASYQQQQPHRHNAAYMEAAEEKYAAFPMPEPYENLNAKSIPIATSKAGVSYDTAWPRISDAQDINEVGAAAKKKSIWE